MSDPLNHLGSIWYHSEPSNVPYSLNQFLAFSKMALVSKLFLASVYFIFDLCLQTTIDQSLYWSFSFRDRKKGPKSFLTTLFATFQANKMRSHKTFWSPQLADWPQNVGKYSYEVEFDISRIFSKKEGKLYIFWEGHKNLKQSFASFKFS